MTGAVAGHPLGFWKDIQICPAGKNVFCSRGEAVPSGSNAFLVPVKEGKMLRINKEIAGAGPLNIIESGCKSQNGIGSAEQPIFIAGTHHTQPICLFVAWAKCGEVEA